MRDLFITSAYRSGSTLLHHLLDGHPELAVFPVENCIYRDMLAYRIFPNPRKRNLNRLKILLEHQAVDDIIEYFFDHEKLSLPLASTIVLEGSTGNQSVDNAFDTEAFRVNFRNLLGEHVRGGRLMDAKIIFDAYNRAYFTAVGLTDELKIKYRVNKCPEKGHLINFYLDTYPQSRVLHIIRDPRAVMASHKAFIPRDAVMPAGRFFAQAAIARDSLRNYGRFREHPRVHGLRYEDLVTSPEDVMRQVSNFLNIEFHDSLLQPTILGKLWGQNSSFIRKKTNTSIDSSKLKGYLRKLNGLELYYIEKYCRKEMAECGYETDSTSKIPLAMAAIAYQLRSLASVKGRLLRLREKIALIHRNRTVEKRKPGVRR